MLLGVKVTLVLNRTAHFSSVTDSEPFRSQRLIFFSSWGGRAEHLQPQDFQKPNRVPSTPSSPAPHCWHSPRS